LGDVLRHGLHQRRAETVVSAQAVTNPDQDGTTAATDQLEPVQNLLYAVSH